MTAVATTNQNRQLAQGNPAVGTLRDLLNRSREQIALALPKHLTPDRMIRVALTAVQKTPALLECSPVSILGCVVQASELGLELTGALGQAYMVPYRNKNTRQQEAQFQIGYRGLQDLAFRSGRVSSFPAHIVYEHDVFDYAYGTKPFLKHKPTMGEPGKVIAAYAVLVLKDGASDFEVMGFAHIERHRKQYSRASGSGPWATAWEEMAKKTVIRRLAKRAPMSIELQRAAVQDEVIEVGFSHSVETTAAAMPQLEQPVQTKADRLADKLGNGTPVIETPPEEPAADELPSESLPPEAEDAGSLGDRVDDFVDTFRQDLGEAAGSAAIHKVMERLDAAKDWLPESWARTLKAEVAQKSKLNKEMAKK